MLLGKTHKKTSPLALARQVQGRRTERWREQLRRPLRLQVLAGHRHCGPDVRAVAGLEVQRSCYWAAVHIVSSSHLLIEPAVLYH